MGGGMELQVKIGEELFLRVISALEARIGIEMMEAKAKVAQIEVEIEGKKAEIERFRIETIQIQKENDIKNAKS
jgi:hypothetical protein